MRIDTKTGRGRLAVRREPYWHKHAMDRHIGYRKTGANTGTWIARYRGDDGKRLYQSLGEHSDAFGFDQAVAKALEWFGELDQGIRPSADTVAGVCRLYVGDRTRQRGEAAGNEIQRRFEREVFGGGGEDGKRHDAHAIGSVMLKHIRTRTIEKWRDGLIGKKLSKATANRTLTSLKAALNYAVRHRYISANLAIEWKSVQPFTGAGRRRDLYLDLTQRRAFLAAVQGSVRDLVEAAMHTGARAGELTSARRSQFDARTQSITLTGKTGTRNVPLSPSAVTLFERLAKGKLPAAWLLTRDDGKPWAHSDWDELVRDAAAKANLPKGTCLYTLRHSWITQAITDGMSPLEVARLVGTSLAMIDKNYGHLAQTTARERLAKVMMV
jgi:integrase